MLLLAPPSVGDIVSFSAESFSRRAAPVGPRIFRIRTDVSWDDVVANSISETAGMIFHRGGINKEEQATAYCAFHEMSPNAKIIGALRKIYPVRSFLNSIRDRSLWGKS